GVRDDIGPDMYGRSDDPAALEAWRRLVSAEVGEWRFDSLPDRHFGAPDEEATHLVARLREAGLRQAIAVDLSPPESEAITVLRMIVPGLEPMSEANCLPGRRARAVMGSRA